MACKFPAWRREKNNIIWVAYSHLWLWVDRVVTLKCVAQTASAKGTAGWVCHVCITRHWFFCRDLALQPFILCFAVGPNGFEKFCYSPVTPEAKVRIDFTCTGLHHLSRAQAVRAKAKWNAIHTQALRQAVLSARRMAGLLETVTPESAQQPWSLCSLEINWRQSPDGSRLKGPSVWPTWVHKKVFSDKNKWLP